MLAARVTVEVLVIRSVKASEPLDLVFHCMRVDYVHNHGYPELMSLVNQALEFLGSAKT